MLDLNLASFILPKHIAVVAWRRFCLSIALVEDLMRMMITLVLLSEIASL